MTLTAPLTWTLLLTSNNFTVRTDIYAVFTGRVVWRALWKDVIDMWILPLDFVNWRLFSSLEPAISEVITKSLGGRKKAINESKNSPA